MTSRNFVESIHADHVAKNFSGIKKAVGLALGKISGAVSESRSNVVQKIVGSKLRINISMNYEMSPHAQFMFDFACVLASFKDAEAGLASWSSYEEFYDHFVKTWAPKKKKDD
jgi:hypothetical protein